MAKSLLFIPDISGFTQFVKTTEVEHSQHVIAELLEVIIDANTLNLELAEIEGDALFFYKENIQLTQQSLLEQIKTMYTAFYSHLKLLEKNRVCTCNACATAPKLQLKIIIHAGNLQFIEVKGNRKPFGNVVIEAHRLLKNSVPNDNYVLISCELENEIGKLQNIESDLLSFQAGRDSYDSKEIKYQYALIEISKLQIKTFEEPKFVTFNSLPNISFEKVFNVSAEVLIEQITNYKNRHNWVEGVDEFIYNEHEVTRLGTEHVCVINGKQLMFKTITKKGKPNQIIYGELTKIPFLIDELYQFFIITPKSNNSCLLDLEVYWKVKSPIKKMIIALFVKKQILKSNTKAMNNLYCYLSENK